MEGHLGRGASGPAGAHRPHCGRPGGAHENQYDVYLHDTPTPELFGREERLFSHGCIRVENPLDLVELVLGDSLRWNRETLRDAIATGVQRTIRLVGPIPVFVLYWTAAADVHGTLHFHDDVYDRDAAILAGLDARRAAGTAGLPVR